MRSEVQSACELLGLDPVYVANEGKAVFFVAPEAGSVLEILQANSLGRSCADRLCQLATQTHADRTHRHGRQPCYPDQIGEQLPESAECAERILSKSAYTINFDDHMTQFSASSS